MVIADFFRILLSGDYRSRGTGHRAPHGPQYVTGERSKRAPASAAAFLATDPSMAAALTRPPRVLAVACFTHTTNSIYVCKNRTDSMLMESGR